MIKLCGAMFYPLSLLFVISLALIIDKILTYKNQPDVAFLMQKLQQKESEKYWLLELLITDEAKKIEKKLNSGLWVLETIITAAPLFGLLGTIIGMMSSFKLIGAEGLLNPGGITSGVAESLIATAYGLIIAIFSLFAFNYFSQKRDAVLDEMEIAGTRLVEVLKRKENN